MRAEEQIKVEGRILEKLRLEWFTDSPNLGESNCTCSLCHQIISKDDIVVRLWDWWPLTVNPTAVIEARFHIECYSAAVRQDDNNCREGA